MLKLQFIGGGRMAEALLSGLLAGGHWDAGDIAVVELVPARREELSEAHPDVAVRAEPVACEGLVVATKPADVPEALAAAVAVGAERVLSIAAGVGTDVLSQAVGGSVPVVRSMPNTPALVGAGATAICGGSTATDEDLVWAESILGSVGITERVPESLMDAVTGLSGSGPAYVFLLAEAMVEAGVLNGLPREVSTRLATRTLLGASQLLDQGDRSAEELRAMVTSPGGTTAEGLAVLEERGVRSAVLAAVTAAARRAGELG